MDSNDIIPHERGFVKFFGKKIYFSDNNRTIRCAITDKMITATIAITIRHSSLTRLGRDLAIMAPRIAQIVTIKSEVQSVIIKFALELI